MDFEQWKAELAVELGKTFGGGLAGGQDYIKGTGDECWREMFDDGLSPKQAASEEAYAAAADAEDDL